MERFIGSYLRNANLLFVLNLYIYIYVHAFEMYSEDCKMLQFKCATSSTENVRVCTIYTYLHAVAF